MKIIRPVGPVNILLVDDKPANLLALEAVLTNTSNYTIVTAASGSEAIELVKRTDFAAILLDVQMPIMDGYETAAAIKRLERGKGVPIIMVTAIYTEDPHVLKGYEVGAIDYIAKPFNTDILKAKVDIYASLYIKSLQSEFLFEAERFLRDEGNARTILEMMPIGVIVANPSGVIEQMNLEARNIWGGQTPVPEEYHSGYKARRGWWLPDNRPVEPHEWAIARAMEKNEPTSCEVVQIQCLDGSRKVVLNTAVPIVRDSLLLGAVDVMQDITAHQGVIDVLVKSFPALK